MTNLSIQNSKEVQQQQMTQATRASQLGAGAFDKVLKSVDQNKSTVSLSKEDRITNAVITSSEKYNLPPALVLGVMKQESGFKPCAESHCGAQGLMQLMPDTARGVGVKNSFDIEQNIDGGCQYLRQMLDQFNGDPKLALAAYNAGPGNVQKYGGIPPFEETQNYVKSVMAHAEGFQGGKLALENNIQSPATVSSLNAGEIQEALTMILMNSQPPQIHMPEKSKNVLAEEPPPPPSYARRV